MHHKINAKQRRRYIIPRLYSPSCKTLFGIRVIRVIRVIMVVIRVNRVIMVIRVIIGQNFSTTVPHGSSVLANRI